MKISAKIFFLLFFFIAFPISIFAQTSQYFQLPEGVSKNDFLPQTIIFKIKPEYRNVCFIDKITSDKIQPVFNEFNAEYTKKKFPLIPPPEKKFNSLGQKYADLSLIYEMKYRANFSIEVAINKLLATGIVEYAQPHYIVYPLNFVPNDPLNVNQYHLSLIKAFQAWEYYKGDSNIVVGICDWGIDYTHPDLVANVKYNYYDPIDGIDNDNDGYTDNFRGWDLGDNDNNPMGFTTHGTFVAGLSSARTNNNLGISGTGFLCKFLPIKVCDTNYQGTMAYEGIVYAVEHGCSIVNCSWGSTFHTGPYGQDVIDYATINKGALVVAACGNDNNMTPYYPASYNYVLSVAMSNAQDRKASASSYGYFVDIIAPGENVTSTQKGGTYATYSGTSYSAPVVSGCAALLKNTYPQLSGLQIGEQLKVTSDVIDTLPYNLPYKDLIGAGRINLSRAISGIHKPSVQFSNTFFTDTDGNNIFAANDTIKLTGDFINYLAPTSNGFKCTLRCSSEHITLIDSVVSPGVINTLNVYNNNLHPFVFYIKPTVPPNEEIALKLIMSDTNYRAVQYITLVLNKNYLDIDTNKISTTLTSNGMLGYYFGNTMQGLGFRYKKGETLLYSGGFIIGRSSQQISDVIYNESGTFGQDFKVKKNLTKTFPPAENRFEAIGEFNDSLAGYAKLNVGIKQKVMAYPDVPNDKYIILHYTIKNLNNTTLTGVYAGLYADWDVKNSTKNRIEFHNETRTGYCFCTEGGVYTGMSLLTIGNVYHYAFDNDGANGSIKIYDGFTDTEKYLALKTNRYAAGTSGQGNDVSQLMSTGPYDILPGDSVEIAFALIAGDHLGDVLNSAQAAYQTYHNYAYVNELQSECNSKAILYQNVPNPFFNQTTLGFTLFDDDDVELSITTLEGITCQTVFKGSLSKGTYTFHIDNKLKPGIYICTLKGKSFCIKRKMCAM